MAVLRYKHIRSKASGTHGPPKASAVRKQTGERAERCGAPFGPKQDLLDESDGYDRRQNDQRRREVIQTCAPGQREMLTTLQLRVAADVLRLSGMQLPSLTAASGMPWIRIRVPARQNTPRLSTELECGSGVYGACAGTNLRRCSCSACGPQAGCVGARHQTKVKAQWCTACQHAPQKCH